VISRQSEIVLGQVRMIARPVTSSLGAAGETHRTLRNRIAKVEADADHAA